MATKPLNEAFLRRIVRESRNFDRSDTVRLWENIPEKKQQKILKKKWLPAGVQPIVAELSPLGQMGFVMCTDGVLYGHGVDFPGDKVSLVGLMGFDANDTLTYEDGSEVTLSKMYFCERWLREIFRATACAYAKPPRQLDFTPAGNELPRNLAAEGVRRMPEFYLPEEMPPHLWAKLQRAFPDLPENKVLGYCDLPESRRACIVLTADSILQRTRYDDVTEIHFKEWTGNFFTDYEEGELVFRAGQEKSSGEKDVILRVPMHLLHTVEELIDYQFALTWQNVLLGKMRTEIITRNKAEFVCRARQHMLDYERDNSLCPNADNPRALAFRAALALSTGVYDEALFYYELQRRTLADADHVLQWAHAGFMYYFYQPLSVTSIKWMMYYMLQFEGKFFFGKGMFWKRWQSYSAEKWGTSLIDQRNEMARRFNAAAEARQMSTVPILDGYVLDYCLEKMKKK